MSEQTVNRWLHPAPRKSFAEVLQGHVEYFGKNAYKALRPANVGIPKLVLLPYLKGYLLRIVVENQNFEKALEQVNSFLEEYKDDMEDQWKNWEEEYQKTLKS